MTDVYLFIKNAENNFKISLHIKLNDYKQYS